MYVINPSSRHRIEYIMNISEGNNTPATKQTLTYRVLLGTEMQITALYNFRATF